MQNERGLISLTGLLLYIIFAAALYTYVMPVISVTLPPFGQKSWSTRDFARPIEKMVLERKTESKREEGGFKINADFQEILKKLNTIKNPDQPEKMSLTYMAGLLVPVALVLTYALILLNIIFVVFQLKGLVPVFSALGVITSVYALTGTYYLGMEAKRSIESVGDRAGAGFFSVLTKSFTQDFNITPDSALYVLAGGTVLIYFISLLHKRS